MVPAFCFYKNNIFKTFFQKIMGSYKDGICSQIEKPWKEIKSRSSLTYSLAGIASIFDTLFLSKLVCKIFWF